MDIGIVGLNPDEPFGAAATTWFLNSSLTSKHDVTAYSLTNGPPFLWKGMRLIGYPPEKGLDVFKKVDNHEIILMVYGLPIFNFKDPCKILREKCELLILECPAPMDNDYLFDLFDYIFTTNKSHYYRSILERGRENIRYAPLAVDKERLYPMKDIDPRSVLITGDTFFAKEINPMIPKLEKALQDIPYEKKRMLRYKGMKPEPSFTDLGFRLIREELDMFLRTSWIYINLHPCEAFGYLNAEALMCGTPVIALHHGDLDLFEHGQQGMLIPRYWNDQKQKWVVRGDLESHFRRSVQEILDDFENFSKRARSYALKHFDPDKNGKIWEQALRGVYHENSS